MIVNRQRKVSVARPPLEAFLRRIRRELNLGNAEISVALVSDTEMARLNRKFRKQKGPTDVLSFRAATRRSRSGSRTGGAHGSEVLGDIAIAPKTAARYAKKNARTLSNEIRVLMLHGVLHLLGYDHETDRGQMNRVEHKLRRRLGLV